MGSFFCRTVFGFACLGFIISAHAKSAEEESTLELLTNAFTSQSKEKNIKCLEGSLAALSEEHTTLLLQLCMDHSKKEIKFSYKDKKDSVPVTGVFTATSLTINEKVKNFKLEVFKGSVGNSLIAFVFDLGAKNKEALATFLEKYILESTYRNERYEIALIPKSTAHKLNFIKLSFNDKRELRALALQMRENFDQYIFYVDSLADN